jgi:hypothetical protein
MKVQTGATVSLIKVVVILVDLNIVHSLNKLYFISSVLSVNHNYTSSVDSSLAPHLSTLFPTIYGPNFSRNCTLALILAFQLNNALPKYLTFDYSTSAGFTNIQEGGDGLTLNLIGLCTADCLTSGYFNASLAIC